MTVLSVTKQNFSEVVENSKEPVLVDFWAAWCGPCKMMAPVLDEVAAEHPSAKIAKVNIDEQPELAAQFGIMSIPTLMVMENGKPVNTAVGVQSKAAVEKMIR